MQGNTKLLISTEEHYFLYHSLYIYLFIHYSSEGHFLTQALSYLLSSAL